MLHGRRVEQAVIDGLLDKARRGISGAAIVRAVTAIATMISLWWDANCREDVD